MLLLTPIKPHGNPLSLLFWKSHQHDWRQSLPGSDNQHVSPQLVPSVCRPIWLTPFGSHQPPHPVKSQRTFIRNVTAPPGFAGVWAFIFILPGFLGRRSHPALHLSILIQVLQRHFPHILQQASVVKGKKHSREWPAAAIAHNLQQTDCPLHRIHCAGMEPLSITLLISL